MAILSIFSFPVLETAASSLLVNIFFRIDVCMTKPQVSDFTSHRGICCYNHIGHHLKNMRVRDKIMVLQNQLYLFIAKCGSIRIAFRKSIDFYSSF